MNVQDLKPFECVQLVGGTGGDTMHIIKGQDNEIYVTRNSEMRRLSANESDETNRRVYEYFFKMAGIKDDTMDVIKRIQNTSRDWYALLLCEMLVKDMKS